MSNILDTFKARHLFEDMTSTELAKALDTPLTVYAGFDPTNDSLQAGNFVTIMALAHLQRAGHRVIALVGGATGLIGDPSGKSKERNLLSAEQVERNLVGIKENLSRFIDSKVPALTALRYYGGVVATYSIWFVPASCLLATLYTMWQLSTHSGRCRPAAS